MLLSPDFIESSPSWRFFGKRYLKARDFISFCDLVGLKNLTENELEEYEEQKLVFPVARFVLPEVYANSFWEHQLNNKEKFEFEDKYLEAHNLNFSLRFPNTITKTEGNNHIIDNYWKLPELTKPHETEFIPWKNYFIDLEINGKIRKIYNADHFYHYWQIYELFEVRKRIKSMYKDFQYYTPFFESFSDTKGEFHVFFDAVSLFFYNKNNFQDEYFQKIDANEDQRYILDENQKKFLNNKYEELAKNIINKNNYSERLLLENIRKMMTLNHCYLQSERYKLSNILRKDIWTCVELISFGLGFNTNEISQKAGKIGSYLVDYLEILFPNKRKEAKDDTITFLKSILKNFNKECPAHTITDSEINKFVDFSELNDLAWFEYIIREANENFFKPNSWYSTISFLHIKSLASMPETLMKLIIEKFSDNKTRNKFHNLKKPSLYDLIGLIFSKDSTNIGEIYNNTQHWKANDKNEFIENLKYFRNKFSETNSENEFIATNLALSTLIRNFTSHLFLDDSTIFKGSYVFCLRAIMNSVASIWIVSKNKNWV
jgi:hypothetical protein